MEVGNTVFGKTSKPSQHTTPPQGRRRPQGQEGPGQVRQPSRNTDLTSRPIEGQGMERQAPSRQEKDSTYFLNRLEEKLKSAKKLPLSEQCVVDRMELLILLDNAKKSLPDDLRRAKWLLDQNQNLISETRKEAEKIMREAEQEIAKMIDEHEITQVAQEEAQMIMEDAAVQSRQIHEEANAYVGKVLQDLEEQLTEMLVYVRKNKSQL